MTGERQEYLAAVPPVVAAHSPLFSTRSEHLRRLAVVEEEVRVALERVVHFLEVNDCPDDFSGAAIVEKSEVGAGNSLRRHIVRVKGTVPIGRCEVRLVLDLPAQLWN